MNKLIRRKVYRRDSNKGDKVRKNAMYLMLCLLELATKNQDEQLNASSANVIIGGGNNGNNVDHRLNN